MAKPKPPKRLFKNTDRVSSYEVDRAKTGLLKHMTRDHVDVLQNVEFVLVNASQADPEIDDRVVHEALAAMLSGKAATDPRAAEIVASLASMRLIRDDVPDDVWHAAIQVVDDSVKLHSSLKPGDVNYLQFASKYVK